MRKIIDILINKANRLENLTISDTKNDLKDFSDDLLFISINEIAYRCPSHYFFYASVFACF